MDPEEKRKKVAPKGERDVMAEVARRRAAQKAQAAKPKPTEAAKPSKPKFLAEHKVAAGDSLSAIASRFYESGAKDKWMLIYEANKELIGDNPSLIQVGQVLKIPKLPGD